MLGMPARARTSVSGTMSSQTFCMQVVEFSGVTAVQSPGLTSTEQDG